MNSLTLSLSLLFLTGTALVAEPTDIAQTVSADSTVASSTGTIDPLSEALPVLLAKYPDFKALQYKEGDHLSDLIARSNGKISLGTPATETPVAAAPIVTVTLPDNIVYWRMASFVPEKSWAELDTQLKGGTFSFSTAGIILDLRSNTTPDDYAGAAQVMSFFAPADLTLDKFHPKNPDGTPFHGVDHPVHAPIVVLTNSQTTGAAEALAACLKADGAIVIGRPTAGKAAIFEKLTLTNGQVLRYAVSDISLADGTQLWGHAINPDVNLTINERSEKGALVEIKHNNVLDVIGESPDRHLMSEAALIQGIDPEWDAYLASLEKKPVLLSLPIIHDEALITALDSLKAIRVSQKGTETAAPDKIASKNTTSVQ